jgi:flagellar biosynthesis protein FlhG
MKTIAITSGKGGVGKSTLAINLALAFAERNQSVILFDADFGLSNIDILLGIKVEKSLGDVIDQNISILEALTEGPNGIRFISGGSGLQNLIDLSTDKIDNFFYEFSKLAHEADYLLIDTAAGIGENVLRFAEATDEVVIVCTTEPTSLMDSYTIAKTLFIRNPNSRVHILMNMVHSEISAKLIFEKLQSVLQSFLSKNCFLAGIIHYDKLVSKCIQERTPFLNQKRCLAANDVRKATDYLLSGKSGLTDEEFIEDEKGFLEKLKKTIGFKRSEKTQKVA